MPKRLRNPFRPEEREIVIKTARRRGAVGGKALVPRAFMELFQRGYINPLAIVLDFGAGPGDHARALRKEGFRVTAHEFLESPYYDVVFHDPYALEHKYDVVYASNVLNVQPSVEALRTTLEEIYSVMKPNAIFIANYPASPRKLPKGLQSVEFMEEEILRYFGRIERIRGFGSRREPVWLIREKK